ncbi:hypothetical protein KUTeg_000395 [Tegillarca granosa]|uniref:Solute carrier organic anion transporter family member n=1 Tax=Tegillarca granosa TaxID=220873 RepID=A0ABQ9FXE6_TEGGR|nr:hypothetical protein KUTeg_000395 [Tegillarca granosa]
MKTNIQDPETQCGAGSCHPKPLQICTNVLMFTLLYSFSGIFTSTNSIYLSSQITTLEKYFGFTSSQTGFLMSCNDIGFLMTTLFISYQARKVHIPRVLSLGGIVFGISGIICSFAYFMSPLANRPVPDVTMNDTNNEGDNFAVQGGHICHLDGGNISLHKCLGENFKETKIGLATEFTPVAMTIFAIGLIIQGVCKSPRQPFVTTYIDDNVVKTQTAFYMGLSFALLIFGPAIGYGIGGFFSKTYVTLEAVDIGPNDPRWIGAWWLGFVVFGGAAVVSGIPLLFFPRRWFKAVIRLFTNPIYALCVASVCIGAFLLAGLSTFMPKYVETQFTLPAWQANILLEMDDLENSRTCHKASPKR